MTEIRHYKCLSDLQKIVAEIRQLRARPIIRGKHPTLYEPRSEGAYRTVMGIRICDYQFNFDETWIQPNPQMGLSFSSTWDNLQIVYGMQTKKAKNKPIDVYWILSEADIPPGLEFVEDMSQPGKGHYFLAVTVKEGMSVETLAGCLERVAYRMNIIKNGGSLL